jgi:hypothetical protein
MFKQNSELVSYPLYKLTYRLLSTCDDFLIISSRTTILINKSGPLVRFFRMRFFTYLLAFVAVAGTSIIPAIAAPAGAGVAIWFLCHIKTCQVLDFLRETVRSLLQLYIKVESHHQTPQTTGTHLPAPAALYMPGDTVLRHSSKRCLTSLLCLRLSSPSQPRLLSEGVGTIPSE